MALDFTTIKDQPGAALLLIHDGSILGGRSMEELADRLKERVQKQIIMVDATSSDGRSIIEFYELEGENFVLLVGDDDELAGSWTGQGDFNVDEIVFAASA